MADPGNDALNQDIENAVSSFSAGVDTTIMNPISAEEQASQMRASLQVGGTYLKWIVNLLVTIGGTVISKFLSLISDFRRDNAGAFSDISKEVLGEFLATDMSGVNIDVSQGPSGSIDAANAIGNALHNTLMNEFKANGPISDDQGAQNARTFSGFAVNFGVQNAILSMMGDCLSVHLLQQVRSLGEETARNLGLGRLQRIAMQPLLNAAIAKPYTRYLNALMRPEVLGVGELIKAYNRGNITNDQLTTQLQRHGYADADIQNIIEDALPRIGVGELERLIRFGLMTQDEAEQHLVNGGVPDDTAKLMLQAAQSARVETLESTWLDQLRHQCKTGFLSQTDFSSTLDKLHLTDDEKTVELRIVGDYIETRFKRPGWAEAVKAYHLGACDQSYLTAWLNNEGYDSEDAGIMMAIAAVQPKSKAPTWAEVKKFYEAGQITMDYVESWLTARGLSPTDVQLEELELMQEAAKAASPTSTTKATTTGGATTTENIVVTKN
jgi:hypothetical protein